MALTRRQREHRRHHLFRRSRERAGQSGHEPGHQITLGALTAVVGYDRANRQAISTGDAVRTLVSATLSLSTSGGSNAASALGTALSGLLQSSDFEAALSRTDSSAIDATLIPIDDALASKEILRASVGFNQSAASRIGLSELLLDGNLQSAASSTRGTSGSLFGSTSSDTTGSQLSSVA